MASSASAVTAQQHLYRNLPPFRPEALGQRVSRFIPRDILRHSIRDGLLVELADARHGHCGSCCRADLRADLKKRRALAAD